MKKLILSLLKSAVGKAIIQIIIDAFLKSLAKKGYYMTAQQGAINRTSLGNLLEMPQYRNVIAVEFIDTELENVKP